MNGQHQKTVKWFFWAFLVLILNSGYLAAFAESSIFYMINVLLHVVLGVTLAIPFFIFVRRYLENDAPKGKELAVYTGKLGYWFLAPCVLTGLYLALRGATSSQRWVLYIHIIAGLIGAVFFQKSIRSVAHKVSVKNLFDVAGRLAWVVVVAAVCIPLFVGAYNLVFRYENDRIDNPSILSKTRDGAAGPFFPSAMTTTTQSRISAKSLVNSESCGRAKCHADIYQQWHSSAHHYSSLNNPWYRKSLAYLQEVSRSWPARSDTNSQQAAAPEKWCAGCHDPALLASGLIERPLPELGPKPEAHAGVSCTACHSIVEVKSTRGQADYVIEAMPLNDWATSENKLLVKLYDFLLRIDPEPHRQSMLKPFHRQEAAEFCSACHKAHLDAAVNQFGWVRSFNDYDAWQAGPFSGRSSRSSHSAAPKNCVDCHMPLTASRDAGNIKGKVHSHLFLGANTALPIVNQDQKHLEATVAFLRQNQVSVDIFALGKPYENEPTNGAEPVKESLQAPPPVRESILLPATHFAVGDEQRMQLGAGGLTQHASEVIAPLNQSNATLRRGEEARVDVVVRSRNVGHFFPTGTVDAHEVWLELQAYDDHGRVIFWSGAVGDAGKGSVDSSAHFYRSYLVDGEGNHIDKNNTWAARQAVYVNLIPPGGADVAHYRLQVPVDCGSRLQLIAKLNYRKFSRQLSQWTFDSDFRDLGVNAAFNNGPWLLAGAGKPAIPEVPIVEMARNEVTLAVVAPEAEKPEPAVRTGDRDWERWNDYGMGLLAQNDLKSAEAAFLKVTRLAPEYAEAWVNIGITHLREGNFEEAQQAFDTAAKMRSNVAGVQYYLGLIAKSQGKYDQALVHLKRAVVKYTRDRVARNERGHLYLLMQDYNRAILDFEKVLSMDPENVEAYYYLIRAYSMVGEKEKAKQAEALYNRFKAEGSPSRRTVGDENALRERLPLHEHFSGALPSGVVTNNLPARHEAITSPGQ